MSNGESKIAIFKAALCCGFAIALRALFLVIRRCDFSRTLSAVKTAPPFSYSPSFAEGVRGWVVMLGRSRNILSLRASVRTRGNQPYVKLKS